MRSARRWSRALRCSASCWTLPRRGDNIGVFAARACSARRSSGGQVLAKPGSIHPHTHFMGQGVRADEGRRRPVTRRSSTATVRSSTSARRERDWQHQAAGKALRWSCLANNHRHGDHFDHADRVRRRSAFRYSRRRPHGRFRRRDEDPRVTAVRSASSRLARGRRTPAPRVGGWALCFVPDGAARE